MSNSDSISRRGVLGFMAALAAVPAFARRTAAAPAVWQRLSPIPTPSGSEAARPRYLHAAVGLPDGRMVVTGGYRVSAATRSRAASAPTESVQIYDPTWDTWTELAPLQTPRARHAAVLLANGYIAVLGGILSSNLSSIEIYDPTQNVWTYGGALPYPMVDLSATLTNSGILVSGGQSGAPAILVPITTVPPSGRP